MEPIIQIKNVTKTFIGKDNQVEALKGISLDINKGDIYGIIGMSGAGKSTLVRCLNYLEKPTTGTVVVEDQDLSTLTEAELRKVRTGIAMIFQHFNLLMQRSVLDNVCFPMEIVGVKKQAARKRAMELLEIVGLKEKADAYPSQLSGGQKQRVAIARALANTPKILLCDEATSALDPTTTKEILKLLQDINKQYGITIVIITHEMAVVQEICSHVAIIDAGELAEHGTVEEVFSRPQSAAARKLVFMVDPKAKEMSGKRCIRIVFTENSSFEPVIANMVLECKAPVNMYLIVGIIPLVPGGLMYYTMLALVTGDNETFLDRAADAFGEAAAIAMGIFAISSLVRIASNVYKYLEKKYGSAYKGSSGIKKI